MDQYFFAFKGNWIYFNRVFWYWKELTWQSPAYLWSLKYSSYSDSSIILTQKAMVNKLTR